MLTFTRDSQEDDTTWFLDVCHNEAFDKVDVAFITMRSGGGDQA